MKKTLLVTLLLLLVGSISHAQIQAYSVGDVAPDFTVTDVNGNTYSLYSITGSGQYVLLDFFFTTCPPCQSTAPIFNELHEKYGCNQGQLFCMSVDVGDSDAEVVQFENTYGGTFSHAPAVSGTEGGGDAVNSTMNIAAYPTYALIGPDNKFISTDIWPIAGVADFEAAFPAGSGITPMTCSAVSVDQALSEATLQLYPNPAAQSTRLDLTLDTYDEVNIEVYDLLGQRVLVQELGSLDAGLTATELDLSQVNNGIYVVRVAQNNQIIASRKLEVMK